MNLIFLYLIRQCFWKLPVAQMKCNEKREDTDCTGWRYFEVNKRKIYLPCIVVTFITSRAVCGLSFAHKMHNWVVNNTKGLVFFYSITLLKANGSAFATSAGQDQSAHMCSKFSTSTPINSSIICPNWKMNLSILDIKHGKG